MEPRTETLLPIGRFSRLSGLSVKALRHYDAIELLPPARVDEDSGYRLYAIGQLREAGAIARLRALDVPLEECREILAGGSAAVRERLERHRARLEGRAEEVRGQLALLDELVSGRVPLLEAAPLEKVDLRERPEQPVATMRFRIPEDDLDRAIGEGINTVAVYLRELGAGSAGPPFTIRGDADEEDVSEVQVGWPTETRVAPRERIESGALPARREAWAVYRGPYEGLPGAYRAVHEWVTRQGLECAGDPREIYYTDPDETPNPADYVTGIVWAIRG